MARAARDTPDTYGVTGDDPSEKLTALDRVLFELKGQLFDGMLFSNCIEQQFDFGEYFSRNKKKKKKTNESSKCLLFLTGLFLLFTNLH